MTLPIKALNVLSKYKEELIARLAEPQPKPIREEKPRNSHRMRHARKRNIGFQRMCQRKDSGWGGV